MRAKIFDNPLLSVFFLFLPFTYALTINLGFPLKISEIALVTFILIFLVKIRGDFAISKVFFIASLFVIVCFVSVAINLFWPYQYPLREYESRFGFQFDSILKFGYLILSYFTFVITTNVFKINQDKYIKYFLLGALLASVYSWYLFFSGLVGIREILLPGIEKAQYIVMSFGLFVRSGTFVEGNHMGLFLFLAMVLSFYSDRKKTGLYFFSSLLPTFSSIALLTSIVFLSLYYFKNYYNSEHVYKLLVFVLILCVSFMFLLSKDDFRVMVISKFTPSDNLSNVGEISKVDRSNSAVVALKMGIENPILGVGLSNYGMHYDYFNDDARFIFANTKRIPNNIYAEIFSEVGIVGVLLFAYLMFLLYRKTRYDQTGSLRYGLIGFLLYCFAFPTFTILYIWVFFGLIASFDSKN